ncbi:Protein of unknown function (DUF1471) [Serratia sp. FGI94]|uniref:DUF1471 domain-containing protein n=1 Tax=Serratia sp. FGI94 TaxID=671990 RepID=UPI0002A7069A|nr:DUF1471 domain-containing protein [Serratia sp. FGI94]AGB80713.1 Protein of unknown function (DUF1471) [Serratia sp. FGI94]
MKHAILAMLAALLLSSGAMAAEEIDAQQASQRQSIGFITLNRNVVSPDDADAQVRQIAERRGAGAYRVIALHEPGSNASIHVSAELYR